MTGVLTGQLGDGVCGDNSPHSGRVERLPRLENVGVSCGNMTNIYRNVGLVHLSEPVGPALCRYGCIHLTLCCYFVGYFLFSSW